MALRKGEAKPQKTGKTTFDQGKMPKSTSKTPWDPLSGKNWHQNHEKCKKNGEIW